VLENLLLVDDFDGHAFAGLLVLGKLNLGKSAFSKELTYLVLPHTRAGACYIHVCCYTASFCLCLCLCMSLSLCVSLLFYLSLLSLAFSTSLSPFSGLRSLGGLSLSHRFHMPALLQQHFEALVNRNSTETPHPSNRPNRPQTGKHDETRDMSEMKGPSIEVFYGKQKRDKTRELWRLIDDESVQTHLLLQRFHSCCSKQAAASSRALSHEAHCHHPASSTQSKGSTFLTPKLKSPSPPR
jgi:hypothetical protein